ncbi:class I SAM-dependent methyltransferase [Magnetospirillum sp. SS-4]|uniref:class I SAM-dependent methyltransferase n=1 Tax=Magnetospirillum sp. SS-4 TaxID=2681465 RepID=UPI001385B047|nr:class I SAM-dependent methyltransferase [Magnetospirillum sp. SS-4]CAA7619656.1 hypothetical protein MTBSS4_250040 [Magnetospirillum sp. SS-4]
MDRGYAHDVRKSADYISYNLRDHFIHCVPFRFCLELFHHALVKDLNLASPSLELGIGCGAASWFMLRDKPNIDFGGDMPMGATAESCGLEVEPRFDHYNNLIGLDMTDLPFPNSSFATILSSETMFYGQDLEKTFAEIFRVLTPGGVGIIFVPTAEWNEYPDLYAWLKVSVPTAEMHADGYFAKLIADQRGEILRQRKFFSSAFEASVLLHSVFSPHGFNADHVRGQLGDPAFAEHYRLRLNTLARMVEKELAQPQGPADGFHDFIVFRKRGSLSPDLPVPVPTCLSCGRSEFRRRPTEMVCLTCGASYAVRCGVEMMLRDPETAYSPSALFEALPQAHRRFESQVHDLIAALALAGRRPYIHNGHRTPIPGTSEASILGAALRFHGVQPAGIYDPAGRRGQVFRMRGVMVIGPHDQSRLAEDGLIALVPADEAEDFLAALAAQGVKGIIQVIGWHDADHGWVGQVVTRSL